MKMMNLTVKELKEMAKEMKIEATGIWKMTKPQLIELIQMEIEKLHEEAIEMNNEVKEMEYLESEEAAIEVENENREFEETVLENQPQPRKKKTFILLNEIDEIVEEFKNQSEAIQYVIKNKIANGGWVRRSLKTGERFYTSNGKPTRNTQYKGVNWVMTYKIGA